MSCWGSPHERGDRLVRTQPRRGQSPDARDPRGRRAHADVRPQAGGVPGVLPRQGADHGPLPGRGARGGRGGRHDPDRGGDPGSRRRQEGHLDLVGRRGARVRGALHRRRLPRGARRHQGADRRDPDVSAGGRGTGHPGADESQAGDQRRRPWRRERADDQGDRADRARRDRGAAGHLDRRAGECSPLRAVDRDLGGDAAAARPHDRYRRGGREGVLARSARRIGSDRGRGDPAAH